jgi:uncharacterized protein
MSFLIRHTLELLLIGILFPLHIYVAHQLWHHPKVKARSYGRTAVVLMLLSLFALMLGGTALDAVRVHRHFPGWVYAFGRGLSLVWMMNCCGCAILYPFVRWLSRKSVAHSPERRKLLQASYSIPAAMIGYGAVIERDRFQLKEVDIPVPGLPKSLHGLRIVQLTDIHMGTFLSERELERVVGLANETKAHLSIMTGDLISKVGDPLDACLRQLSRIKADAGMIGCLGNHEIYASAEAYTEEQGARLGIDFLRNRSRKLVFDGHALHFAGVDYQSKSRGPYLQDAERLAVPGEMNILLSHNPDVFRISPQKGFQLTLSGHTHGGQIAVEYLNPHLNVASFVTPYVAGYYHEREGSLYVSRGIGTIGVPARIGVPPEVTLIRLCAI